MSKQQCCYCDSRSHHVLQCPKDKFVVTSILENTRSQFDFKSLNTRLLKRMLHVFKSMNLECVVDAKPTKDIIWNHTEAPNIRPASSACGPGCNYPSQPCTSPLHQARETAKKAKNELHDKGIYTPPNVLPNLETLLNKKCNRTEMVWAARSHHKALRRLRYRRKTKNQKNRNKGGECPICYTDMNNQYCTLVCDHKVCKTCYPRLWVTDGYCREALCPMCRHPQTRPLTR